MTTKRKTSKPKKWVQKTVRTMDKGAFRAFAEKHGMTTRQAIKEVLAHPQKYGTHRVRQANLAKTFLKINPNIKKPKVKRSSSKKTSSRGRKK